MTPLERFVDKLVITDHCWQWTGAISTTGYGTFWVDRRYTTAHRFAYETFVGPVPAGLELDHLCRNRPCANPDHLEPVTRRENTLRGIGPAAINAVKTACLRGHPLDAENTYRDRQGRRSCRVCRKASNDRLTQRRQERRAA